MELNESTAQAEAQGDEVSGSWCRPGGDMGSGISRPQAFCMKGVTRIAMLWLRSLCRRLYGHRQNVIIKPRKSNKMTAEEEMIYELLYPPNSYNNQNI